MSSLPDTHKGGWESRDLLAASAGSRSRKTPLRGLRDDIERWATVRERFVSFVLFVENQAADAASTAQNAMVMLTCRDRSRGLRRIDGPRSALGVRQAFGLRHPGFADRATLEAEGGVELGEVGGGPGGDLGEAGDAAL